VPEKKRSSLRRPVSVTDDEGENVFKRRRQVPANDNSSKLVDSLSPRSDPPASIEQLVMEAEDLVVMRRRPSRMVRSTSYVKGGTKRETIRAAESDHEDPYEDDKIEGMDCRVDDYRRSMHSSSSLSHLVSNL
jgi:hypothetical protein